jgi:hypothetical protein
MLRQGAQDLASESAERCAGREGNGNRRREGKGAGREGAGYLRGSAGTGRRKDTCIDQRECAATGHGRPAQAQVRRTADLAEVYADMCEACVRARVRARASLDLAEMLERRALLAAKSAVNDEHGVVQHLRSRLCYECLRSVANRRGAQGY